MSLFDKAKTASVPAPKAKKKSDKVEITLRGLENYAAADMVKKSLEALLKTQAAALKSNMLVSFIAEGMKLGRRPENFRGVEGTASASCEIKCRSVSSPLSTEEVDLLTENGIPFVEIGTVVETFIFNPAYANDSALLERISKALEGVEGLPEDLIQHQSEKKICVDEKSIDAVFALKDAKKVAALLPLVVVPSIKPTISDEKKALEMVKAMLGLNTSKTES